MTRAACAASCMATCATPGSGVPPWCRNAAASPTTKSSECPGMERSGSTRTRPARSSGTPRVVRSGDAATPAAHRTVPATTLSPPSIAPRESTPVTAVRSRTSTPSRCSEARAASRSLSGNEGRIVGPASTRMMRAWPVSMDRNSSRSVRRAISARVPASSTPVGPPPTRTKVSSSCRLAGSLSRSARSNASSTRRRISSASSSVLSPGASRAHSSCPKYAWVVPVATIK